MFGNSRNLDLSLWELDTIAYELGRAAKKLGDEQAKADYEELIQKCLKAADDIAKKERSHK